MGKIALTGAAVCVFLTFHACKKSEALSNARTVQNLSGTYVLTSLMWTSWTSPGYSFNAYDSMPACEKDNTFRMNADGTAYTIDTNIPCNPPEANPTLAWNLSSNADSIYFNNLGVRIKSWDGKTLVYTGIPVYGPPQIIATTTWVKQ